MSWFNSLKPLSEQESIIMKRMLLQPCRDCYLSKICDFDCKLYWKDNLITGETTIECDNFKER